MGSPIGHEKEIIDGRERSSGKVGEGEAGEQFALVEDAEDLKDRCMAWGLKTPLA